VRSCGWSQPGGAARTINNPLTVVSGELQLLAREAGSGPGHADRGDLEALRRIRESSCA
jgi:hypothetical protein